MVLRRKLVMWTRNVIAVTENTTVKVVLALAKTMVTWIRARRITRRDPKAAEKLILELLTWARCMAHKLRELRKLRKSQRHRSVEAVKALLSPAATLK